ncbi:hypothetical protein BGZ76_000002 [Entomortierella beljakovae]|nr:hypothetical protein BGZ76_000002 [Entomortierella beljakovae]
MTITIIQQAPSVSEARIRYTLDNVTLYVTPASNLIQNPGTIYIADECLYFFSSASNTGFSISYPSIIIHAIARESHVGPSIYCQLEGTLATLGSMTSKPSTSTNGNGSSNKANKSQGAEGDDEDEEEEEEEDAILEMSFAPADVSALDTIYENLSYCASLHQDDEAGDMDEDDFYMDDVNDHEGLYADADIQGGYIPKSSSSPAIGISADSSSSSSSASATAGTIIGENGEQALDIDLQSGEWYTGNTETDASFQLSEQGQVTINQWRQNEKQVQETHTGKRERKEEDEEGQDDEEMEAGEGDSKQDQEYTEEEVQEARSKMWRAY